MAAARRSAKAIVNQYVNELMARTNDKDVEIKLQAIEVICLRMSWNDIYNRLRFRKNSESGQPWWMK